MNKLFCIGLSRTGTTSIHKALNILGINSFHFPTNNRQIKSHKALSDITISYRFEQLDKKYPNSKFIFTTRDIEGWLKSCKYHFEVRSSMSNIKSGKWKKILSKARKDMYGIDFYNEKVWRDVCIRHTDYVKEYFKNRGDDLLIIDICSGEGWKKICPFLNCSIPNKEFPHAFRTK